MAVKKKTVKSENIGVKAEVVETVQPAGFIPTVSDGLNSAERQEILDEYARQAYGITEGTTVNPTVEDAPHPPEKEEVKEEVKEEKAETDSEKTSEAASPTEKKDDTVYIPATVEEKKTENKEDKQVPLSALHEEREKRKAYAQQLRDQEAINKALEKKIDEYERRSKASTQREDESDEDFVFKKDIKSLKTEIEELKNYRDASVYRDQNFQAQQTRDKISKMISDTDAELESEGFKGFKEMQDLVSREIGEIVSRETDPSEQTILMQVLDTPVNWKKIYKDRVFPKVKGLFVGADKQEIFAKKTESKEKANLAAPYHQIKEPNGEGSKDWTYDDYIKDRAKGVIS